MNQSLNERLQRTCLASSLLILSSWAAAAESLADPTTTTLQNVVCTVRYVEGDPPEHRIFCPYVQNASCNIESPVTASCIGSRLGEIRCEIYDEWYIACRPTDTESLSRCQEDWLHETESRASSCYEAGPGLVARAEIRFGEIAVGDRSLPDTATLRVVPDVTGRPPLRITSVSTSPNFAISAEDCVSKDDLAECRVDIVFTPGTAGPIAGALAVTTDAITGNLTLPLSGTGSGTPTRVFFTNIGDTVPITSTPLGTSGHGHLAFANTGNATASYVAAFDNNEFSIVADSCGGRAAPQSWCNLTVRFAPVAEGPRYATLSMVGDFDNGPNAGRVMAVGLPVIASITISAATLDFGRLYGGGSATRHLTVINQGNVAVTVRSAEIDDGADTFVLASPAPCLRQLQPGNSCELDLRYRPGTFGTHVGILNIVSTATQSPLRVSLKGRLMHELTEATISARRIVVGRVPVGGAAAGSVTLANTGPNPVDVGPAAASPYYRIDFGKCASPLPPGEQCTLQLIATPLLGGVFVRQVELPINTAEQAVAIELIGFGDESPFCP